MSDTKSLPNEQSLSSENAQNKLRFPLLTEADLENIPVPDFLIDSILPGKSLAGMFGPSGVGKSFLALDMACSIATGLPFLNRPVKQGSVIYVAGEGVSGIRKRVMVWRKTRSIEKNIDNLHFVASPVQLYANSEDIIEFYGAIKSHFISSQPLLIVFDTLARCMLGGDENSATHMGQVIQHADWIRKETDATPLIIHHSGRNGEHERGSTAFGAALDTLLRVEKRKDGIILSSRKAKDFAEFDNIAFRLVKKDDSCVIELQDNSGNTLENGLRTLPGSCRKMLVSLHKFGVDGATSTTWRLATTAIASSTFQNGLSALKDAGYIHSQGEGRGSRYVLTETGKALLTPSYTLTTVTIPDTDSDPLVHHSPSKEEGDDVGTDQDDTSIVEEEE